MVPVSISPTVDRVEDKAGPVPLLDGATSREKYLPTRIIQIGWPPHARVWGFKLRLTEQKFATSGVILTKFDYWFSRENISKSIKWEPATKIIFMNAAGDPIGESFDYDHDLRGCYRGEIAIRDRRLRDNYFDLITAYDIQPPSVTFIGCGDDD